MAQRVVYVPEVGEVLLSKRRGSKHIRLSISATGKVRVGLPSWLPYTAGIEFAKSKSAWINEHLSQHNVSDLKNGDLIGKAHRVRFVLDPTVSATKTHISKNDIVVTSYLSFDQPSVQNKALLACERALKTEAGHLLPQRLATLASQNDFSYKDVRVRKLTARWGSCSSTKDITLSYYLIQLPWHLIDYVLLHELMHTKYLDHSKQFWSEFQNKLPKARQFQKEIRSHKPRIYPNASVAKMQ